ncbi:nuclear transport factor 2 family protein [Kitasatospora sp. GAS204B]|uniref:nuclear transport factor 2 family protein n=1 Tax=unclassified Kitasatospora TaxID=2633591 RepID=UPI002473BEB5|nr:nuclear transport factor 2 family protein [Kitasatospora sp. GAS204B]MDH6121818.1 ketosteroid isomerase-like protein [Kitasatospora sp. GAS204B]
MHIARRHFMRAGAGAAVAVPAVFGATQARAAAPTAPQAPTVPQAVTDDTVATPLQVAQQIATSVVTKVMPDVFADNAVYLPKFALPGAPQCIVGKDAILQYFAAASSSPASSALQIQELDPVYYPGSDPEVVTMEFTIKGVNTTTGKPFDFNASIGVLRVQNGRIVEWHDYSNSIGGATAAGMLPQLIGALQTIAAQ